MNKGILNVVNEVTILTLCTIQFIVLNAMLERGLNIVASEILMVLILGTSKEFIVDRSERNFALLIDFFVSESTLSANSRVFVEMLAIVNLFEALG